MSQAKNRQQYIKCWEDHWQQMISVFSDAELLATWEEVNEQMQSVLTRAANLSFPDQADLPAFLRVQAS